MLRVDNSRIQRERSACLAPGAVPDAILLRKYSPRRTPAGARRMSTRVRCPVCRLILVGRLARDLGRDVHIHAIRSVMQDPVRHVRPWAQHKIVSVEGTRLLNVARTLTTRMGGVVVRFVVICCHVVNIPVLGLATRVSAVLAMSKSKHDVIVAVCRPRCCAVPEMKRSIVRNYGMIHRNQLRIGPVALLVENYAIGLLIAVSISARRAVTRKMHNQRIVPGRLTWCLIARVEKRH